MGSCPPSESAWVSWDHHEGLSVRHELDAQEGVLGISDVMRKAFKAGWEAAGGDQRLEAVEQLQLLIGDCPCHDRQYSESDLCVTCTALNGVLKILDEDEAVSD